MLQLVANICTHTQLLAKTDFMATQGILHREVDIEDLAVKYDACISKTFQAPSLSDSYKCLPILKTLLERSDDFQNSDKLRKLLRKHHCIVKNSYLFQAFVLLRDTQGYTPEDEAYIRNVLKIKAGKSHSGIVSITVFTSANPEYIDEDSGELRVQKFSCKWNCAYCPNEPGQPRSYLKGEPGVLRANRSSFNCLSQMHERMKALYLCGHECDKLEVLVLGGTWTSYPVPYREQFVRDIYYAANTFYDSLASSSDTNNKIMRERLSLDEEKAINRDAKSKVIGLTMETRSDTITAKELKLLRHYGCTRVQLGIQHIDNDVLKTINRQCKTETVVKAIRLLKDSGFKIDGHWMPNLPGSTLEKDTHMFIQQLLGVNDKRHHQITHCDMKLNQPNIFEIYALHNPEMQVDQWKVYPTTIVPFTDIESWFKQGVYVPYPQDDMKDLLICMKTNMLPWIRLNRIVRDIPDEYSLNMEYRSNMRQDLLSEMKTMGKKCNCIRCREVKQETLDLSNMTLVTREYNASNGDEYFISFETPDLCTLYGFIRLRLTTGQPTHIFPELEGCALIRELHVYGNLQPVGTSSSHVQHKGLGKSLMATAEDIAKQKGFQKISVIAGEGTRGYYQKLGYHDHDGVGQFMIKSLSL